MPIPSSECRILHVLGAVPVLRMRVMFATAPPGLDDAAGGGGTPNVIRRCGVDAIRGFVGPGSRAARSPCFLRLYRGWSYQNIFWVRTKMLLLGSCWLS